MKGFRSKAKSWVLFTLRVFVYLVLATLANIRNMWNWMCEPRGFLCDRPSRGAAPNTTKIKVLVYGLPKTGTTSTSDILGDIYDKSWHSEDLLLHVWAPFADRFWLKEENGGSIWTWGRLATPAAPAYKGHSLWPREEYASDRIVMKGMDRGELAEFLEKCNVDSLTFDGMEHLFWPIYDLSPEAKVIFLNWRTYDEWLGSNSRFGWQRGLVLASFNFMNVGQHYLPWNAFAIPLLDYFLGTATELMKNGNRMLHYDSLLVLLLRQSVTERRFLQHHMSGLAIPTWNEHQYHEHFDYAKKIIPEERRFELDLRKHSIADLCKMLGVTDRPICKDRGKIPTSQPLMNMERERFHLVLAAFPWFMFLHWANHTLTWTVLYWVCDKFLAIVLGCGAKLGWDRDRLKRLLNGNKKSKKA